MSWNGFKKATSRMGTQVMMKTGHVEKTTDRDYEVEERRFRVLESAANRLQKEAKGYLDSLRAMTASQMRIAETIDAFYGESGAKDGVSMSYKQAVEDLDAETIKALDGPYRSVPTSESGGSEDGDAPQGRVVYHKETEEEILAWRDARKWPATFTQHYRRDNIDVKSGLESKEERALTDYIYRTTVLEPINRFCAYFPDINECIKKRNHKMLDYDQVRARVKRLTEKPDKDPGKLPRTEKEMEMVSFKDFISEAEGSPDIADQDLEPDFSMPSPPKISEAVSRLRKLQQDDEAGSRRLSLGSWSKLGRSPSLLNRVSSLRHSAKTSGDGENMLQRSLSVPSKASAHRYPSSHKPTTTLAETSTEALLSPDTNLARSASHRTVSMPLDAGQRNADSGSLPVLASPKGPLHRRLSSLGAFSSPKSPIGPSSPLRRAFSTLSPTRNKLTVTDDGSPHKNDNISTGSTLRARAPTPFLHPSELEEIMQPLREQYIKDQTDEFKQAKVAYLQLNEQLTNELPQLIDLRVPYLDPSFEALVKIQLRFCAEAYSRMAQVQQYLDASTRDQYANGDLDARVEDVLGQIRELSIAGTV